MIILRPYSVTTSFNCCLSLATTLLVLIFACNVYLQTLLTSFSFFIPLLVHACHMPSNSISFCTPPWPSFRSVSHLLSLLLFTSVLVAPLFQLPFTPPQSNQCVMFRLFLSLRSFTSCDLRRRGRRAKAIRPSATLPVRKSSHSLTNSNWSG